MGQFCAGKKQASNLKELQFLLKTHCFFQREMADVKKDMPNKIRQIIKCQLDKEHRFEYETAERDLMEYLKNYKQASDESIARSMRGEVMVRIGILKHISARGKLADVCSFIKDTIESGEKIVIFANLHDIFDRLKKTFPDALMFTGKEKTEVRDANKMKFQNDPDAKLILCNIKTGSEGLDLSASTMVGFVEYDWTAKGQDQMEARIVNFEKNNDLYSYYFAGENTYDERNFEIINTKRVISNEVTGGINDVE